MRKITKIVTTMSKTKAKDVANAIIKNPLLV